MADNIENLTVAIDVDGSEKLVDAAAKADGLTAATNRARDARGRFIGGSGGGGSSSPEADLADGMTRAARATDDLAEKSEKGKSKVAGFGQSMLQSGRIVQDFAQGGLGGILNNIEGMTQALGLGSGLAGALTIVGVGFMLLKPQIAEFVKSLTEGGVQQFTSHLEQLNARIKELEDKPHKMTVDVQELETAKGVVEQIKAALAAVDKLRKGQAHYEKESGSSIESMIAESEGGGQGVHQRLRDAMQGDAIAGAAGPIKAQEDALRGKIAGNEIAAKNLDAAGQSGAAARVRGENGSLEKQLEQLGEKRLAAVNDAIKPGGTLDQQIGGVLKEATGGSGAGQAQAQGRLAELLGKAGLGNLATGVRAAGPAQLLANDQADDDLEASIEAQKAGIKRRDEAKKKADAAAKAKKQADGAPMDDAARIFKGEQEAAKAKRKADGAPMDDAVRIFKGEQEAKKGEAIRRRAGQIEGQSAFFTGQQFSPEQAQHAAQRSIALQARGLNANQATVQAMGEMLATMAGFGAKIEHLEQQIAGIHGNARQLNRRAHQRQPSALNSGGPM